MCQLPSCMHNPCWATSCLGMCHSERYTWAKGSLRKAALISQLLHGRTVPFHSTIFKHFFSLSPSHHCPPPAPSALWLFPALAENWGGWGGEPKAQTLQLVPRRGFLMCRRLFFHHLLIFLCFKGLNSHSLTDALCSRKCQSGCTRQKPATEYWYAWS